MATYSASATFDAPRILNILDDRVGLHPDATGDEGSDSDTTEDEWKPRAPPKNPTHTVSAPPKPKPVPKPPKPNKPSP